MRIGITGCAGFIGSHLVKEVAGKKHQLVWTVDSLRPAYGGDLCFRRLDLIERQANLLKVDLATTSPDDLAACMPEMDVVVHLAAMPGVRGGESHPDEYFQANVGGFQNLLIAAERQRVGLIVFASSSSVYGDRGINGPCVESDADGSGIKSHYAMTKWINEMQARDFTRRTGIPTVGLRFFTVYGEWGRPDMAYYKFGEALLRNEPITLYGKDGGIRNYTYINEVVKAIEQLMRVFESAEVSRDLPPALNVATGKPLSTLAFVEELAFALGQSGMKVIHLPRPSEDARATWADTALLTSLVGSLEPTPISEGLRAFGRWLIDEAHLQGDPLTKSGN